VHRLRRTAILLDNPKTDSVQEVPVEATDIYDYLRVHASELGSRILESYPPLQSMTDEVPAELSALLRTPLPAQAIAIGGLSKHLKYVRAAFHFGCGNSAG
jgi:hypothetical protein